MQRPRIQHSAPSDPGNQPQPPPLPGSSRLLAPPFIRTRKESEISASSSLNPRSPQPPASPLSNPGLWVFNPPPPAGPRSQGSRVHSWWMFPRKLSGVGEHFLGPESANTQGSLKVTVRGRSQPPLRIRSPGGVWHHASFSHFLP